MSATPDPSSPRYRICKSFEVESGHMLSKHADRCRFPHGHSRRIDIVLSADALDDHDMVCDFKAIKTAVADYLDTFDHAMAINSNDPNLERLQASSERMVVFENTDPTTEVMAKAIFEYVTRRIAGGTDAVDGLSSWNFAAGLQVEKIRVTETSTSWAEYGY